MASVIVDVTEQKRLNDAREAGIPPLRPQREQHAGCRPVCRTGAVEIPSIPNACVMSDAMHDVRPEQYPTVMREMIRHENDVTNHRLMWLLIVQGLLKRDAGGRC